MTELNNEPYIDNVIITAISGHVTSIDWLIHISKTHYICDVLL